MALIIMIPKMRFPTMTQKRILTRKVNPNISTRVNLKKAIFCFWMAMLMDIQALRRKKDRRTEM
jgi:hypothetical protein